MTKRVVDLIGAGIGLLFLSPFLAIIALLIKLDSRGPVFYRGLRMGRAGKPFRIFKFRSMVPNAEQLGAASTNASDPRVTRMGRLMRKLKVDELPQLLNVISGEMSLVGPRPEVRKFVDLYTEQEKVILTVRPGITDWASLKFHNEGEIIEASGIPDADEAYARLIRPEKLRLQQEYVKNHSVAMDLRIVLLTLQKIIMRRNGDARRPRVTPRTS